MKKEFKLIGVMKKERTTLAISKNELQLNERAMLLNALEGDPDIYYTVEEIRS